MRERPALLTVRRAGQALGETPTPALRRRPIALPVAALRRVAIPVLHNFPGSIALEEIDLAAVRVASHDHSHDLHGRHRTGQLMESAWLATNHPADDIRP